MRDDEECDETAVAPARSTALGRAVESLARRGLEISQPCDRCAHTEQLMNLATVAAYSFGGFDLTPNNDPKIFELNYVCRPCRLEFIALMQKFKDKKRDA